VQFEWPGESAANTYTVMPCESTRTVPAEVEAVPRTAPGVTDGVDAAPEPPVPLELPHAARSRAAEAAPTAAATLPYRDENRVECPAWMVPFRLTGMASSTTGVLLGETHPVSVGFSSPAGDV